MDSSADKEVSSRSASFEGSSRNESSPVSQLPAPVEQYFQAVSVEGLAAAKRSKAKAQPWKSYWDPQGPSEDGKLIVACPKICAFGSNNGGS